MTEELFILAIWLLFQTCLTFICMFIHSTPPPHPQRSPFPTPTPTLKWKWKWSCRRAVCSVMEKKGPVGNCFCQDQPSRSTTLPHLFYLMVILSGKPGKGFFTEPWWFMELPEGLMGGAKRGRGSPCMHSRLFQEWCSGRGEGDGGGETDQNPWLPSPPTSAASVEWEWAGDPLCLTGNEEHTSVPLGLVFQEWIGLKSSGVSSYLCCLSLTGAHYSELCRH